MKMKDVAPEHVFEAHRSLQQNWALERWGHPHALPTKHAHPALERGWRTENTETERSPALAINIVLQTLHKRKTKQYCITWKLLLFF